MQENFNKAVNFVFFWEKWLSSDAAGGTTVWGISKKHFPLVVSELMSLSEEESKAAARSFYELEFWSKINGHLLAPNLDVVAFDAAVNQGLSVAKLILKNATDWRDAIILRLDAYDSTYSAKLYLKGWAKRLVSLRDYISSDFTILKWD